MKSIGTTAFALSLLLIAAKRTASKIYYTILLLLLIYPILAQQDNITALGIPDSLYAQEYPELSGYRSKINFPPFIGWDAKGKKMLFNGGKVIYSMKKPQSEIKYYKKFDHPLGSSLSPDHRYFLYEEDSGGDENYQLLLYHTTSKQSLALSAKGDKTYDPFWCPDNTRIAYKSNKRKSAEIDLYLRPIAGSNQERLVFKDFSDDGQVYDWSVEKQQLLAVKVISENNKLLYLIDDQSGAIEQINSNKTNIAYSDAQFIPQQNACLIVSDEFSEFLQLQYYDLDKKEFTNLTANISWDIEALSIDQVGQHAAFSVNEDGASKLYILDLKTLKYTQVPNFPQGVIRDLIINPSGTKVGFNFYAGTFYRKIYAYDIPNAILNQYSRKGKLPRDSIAFAQATSFTYPSVDPDTKKKYEIPAFIYRASKHASAPVLIDIHGGPEYQARATFNNFHQYLVKELGITVIVPNIRGSNGYGKSYMKMDDGRNRKNAIEDVGALLDWIKKQPTLDSDRVAIYGESYGGFVALASLVEFAPKIKCGIDIVGISNWVSYLKNTSDYRRDLRRVEFGDERDEEMRQYLDHISPFNNAEKITSPLLIFQGLNDPRVNYQESEQIYHALEQKGKEVWYVLAKDEGHGFNKYRNYMFQRNLCISFLKKHLALE